MTNNPGNLPVGGGKMFIGSSCFNRFRAAHLVVRHPACMS